MKTKIFKLQKLINENIPGITVSPKDDCVVLTGEVNDYQDLFQAGKIAAETKDFYGVINKITVKGYTPTPERKPNIKDKSLDGLKLDVLVIGGGVIGSAILRELSKYKLNTLLVEKEEDLAMQASGRNDGCIHMGADLHKGQKKLAYLQRAVKMYPQMCKELEVDYRLDGQTVGFDTAILKPFVKFYLKRRAKKNKIPGLRILSRKKLLELEPNLSESIKFGANFPSAGVVCPYGLTIALAESAVINGAKVKFNTYVESMKLKDHKIISVKTNRGTIYPRVVVNAAGVFSDIIADMADDQFFTIHPRKGTDTIMDKSKTKDLSRTGITVFKVGSTKKTHSKGGGIIPTIDLNILVGPDAIEQPEREDFTTCKANVDRIFDKHKETMNKLSERDIITYFSGIRAATYEEDFVVQKGKWTSNIVHAAGIQSPGLTAAPAIAQDIARFAVEELGGATPNTKFNPIRKNVIQTRNLSDDDRDALIKTNPNYGKIICRCEEISKGEIIDSIHSVIPPTTTDGIKRRVRAGMGRCQGGFCQPLVAQILAEETGEKLTDIRKKGTGRIMFRDTKGEQNA